MRRLLYMTAFFLLLLSVPLWAQRGGAHISSGRGFAPHSGSSFHSGSFHGGSFHSGSYRGGSFNRRVSGRGRGEPSRHGRRGFYGLRSYYPYYPYAYYPYLDNYGWYADSFDDQPSDTYAESYNPPPVEREDNGLRSDVQALNGKIDRLQSDVEARNHAKVEQEPETALVFRDKHVEEVRNYAISGGTLWVLNDRVGKKIPLTQLDLDATVKMNDDRGVDFQLPEPALQLMIVR